MKIVEESVSAGDRVVFELEEFLSRPLYAHLAHGSDQGPRESPVWFHWDGSAIWIIGGTSFPANLERDPRCALGIVDWDLATGMSHHVGMRGKAQVLPFDPALAKKIFRRYLGSRERDWDPRFDYTAGGAESGMTMVRFTPETVVVRDQSYRQSSAGPLRSAAQRANAARRLVRNEEIDAASHFAEMLRTGPRLELYEGLPHQKWEGKLLERERATKPTIELGEYPFYEKPLVLSPADEARLLDVLSKPGTYQPFGGEKRCGGFHPDYAVACRSDDARWTCLICFGCAEVKVLAPSERSRNDMHKPAQRRLEKILRPYRKNRPTEESSDE